MEIRKSPEAPKLTRPVPPQEGEVPEAKGIMAGGCILPSPLPIDKDRFEFSRRDSDKSGTLTSDEYGIGKKRQAEFFRYDSNHDGKLSFKEFKMGRFLDRIRDVKPAPMPLPKLPDGGLKPVPMPIPKTPDFGEIKPVPMPIPKTPDLGEIKPVPVLKQPFSEASESKLGSLVAKVKEAQENLAQELKE